MAWKSIFALSTCVVLAVSNPAPAEQIELPAQTVGPFTFSAIVLETTWPAVSCVVTGPGWLRSNISVLVTLYEAADATAPYAQVAGTVEVSPSLPTGRCNINNGPQQTRPARPARIRIQITTPVAVIETFNDVPVPAK